MNLKINEIFYSIQGEGANAGMPAIFIRLAGCNLNCSFCDTNFEEKFSMDVENIKQVIQKWPCKTVVWTGGEPTLQLTDEILEQFPNYYHCIETNGMVAISRSYIDYISCSPKNNQIIPIVNEYRFLWPGEIPEIKSLPYADNYYISPILSNSINLWDKEKNRKNIEGAIEYVKTHPGWKLSIQMHKLAGFK